MTKNLYLLCKGCMGLSFASIFVPNVYYNTKFVYNDFCDEFCPKTKVHFTDIWYLLDSSVFFLQEFFFVL